MGFKTNLVSFWKTKNVKKRGRRGRGEEEGEARIKGMELLNLSMDLWFCRIIILPKPRVC